MSDGGRIISIGSNLAERVPFPGVALYAMSKSALIGFTKGLARDVGDRGITVNLVQPGSTDTDMNPVDGHTADEQRALAALGRYADAREIANTVAFLAVRRRRTSPARCSLPTAARTPDDGVADLVVAGLLEIVWAIALKQSDGFSRLWPSVVGVGGAVLSFALLALALRQLPAGTGYAVWVGIGAVGVALAGMILFGEAVSVARVLFLSIIVVGIVGLRLVET